MTADDKFAPHDVTTSEVIAVDGDLDVATARHLRERITHHSLQGSVSGDVIVDLSAVGFTDSAGLNGLIVAHYDCEALGRRLTLVNIPVRLRRLLELAGLDTVLHLTTGKS